MNVQYVQLSNSPATSIFPAVDTLAAALVGVLNQPRPLRQLLPEDVPEQGRDQRRRERRPGGVGGGFAGGPLSPPVVLGTLGFAGGRSTRMATESPSRMNKGVALF